MRDTKVIFCPELKAGCGNLTLISMSKDTHEYHTLDNIDKGKVEKSMQGEEGGGVNFDYSREFSIKFKCCFLVP